VTGQAVRREPCDCGGVIIAIEGLEPEAVAQHNMSLTHVVWRSRREASTADWAARDLSAFVDRASVPPVTIRRCET
jgi:hypothetical protein